MIRSEERIGSEPITKLFFSLALPALLAQLVNLLYSIVDRIYIGHIAGIGATALTGVGLCTALVLIVSSFAAFAGNGGAPLASIELGKGNREGASRILSSAVVMIIASSVVITTLLLIYKQPLLFFFGASSDTIVYANDYITIYLFGTLFVQIALGLNTFITCQGKAKVAMFSVVIGAAANIILDPIFIFGFDMGVKGAALATVISQFISAVWVLRFLLSKKSVIHIVPAYMKPNFNVIGKIASLGVSPFIMQATESVIAVAFTSGLQKYGGDLHVGAYTVLQSVMQLMFLPSHGFSFGAQPIISYNYGAGNLDRVKKTIRLIVISCLSYTTIFFACVLLFPRVFAGLFTNNQALVSLTAEKLPIFLAGMTIFAFQMGAQSAALGMGMTKFSLFLACLRKIVLLTPLALALPLFIGVNGIYLAEPISDAASACASMIILIVLNKKYLCAEKLLK